MPADNASTLPVGAEWEYELGWAGERVLITKDGASVRLTSVAHHRDLTNRFPVIAAVVARLPVPGMVIDGVVRVIYSAAGSLFHGLRAAMTTGTGAVRLIALDLLCEDERDYRKLPLRERRSRLRHLVSGSEILLLEPLLLPMDKLVDLATSVGAEWIFAKRRDSRYRPFARAGDWVRAPLGWLRS